MAAFNKNLTYPGRLFECNSQPRVLFFLQTGYDDAVEGNHERHGDSTPQATAYRGKPLH